MYAGFAGAKTGVLLIKRHRQAHKSPNITKKNPHTQISNGGFRIKAWQCPTFTWGDPTLSSALSSFTSEFGMGSGGSNSLLPPGKLAFPTANNLMQATGKNLEESIINWFVVSVSTITTLKLLGCYMVKPHGQLVLVSFMHYCTSTPSLSTL